MMKERLTLVFKKDDEVFRYNWVIKKGIRGSRDANKVRRLQQVWGDPVEIIGDGHVARLLRKEYEKYNQNKIDYSGVSTKDLLVAGAEVTGVPVKKLQELSGKLRKKIGKIKNE